MKERVASALAESPLNELAVYLLGNVPGLPPIAQSIHILGIAAVMGSIVMVDLRFLGLAVPSQNITEMIRRLLPWTWWALPINLLTGLLFVVARPNRYFYNPVFSWKFSCLVPAVALAFIVFWVNRKRPGFWEASISTRLLGRLIAIISLLLWTGVVLAGRWIAYSDYLYFLYE
jgi:hypothetical protein